jgi:dipeptidyl aminopeptidase/acylaminoacyl peptidase
MPRSGLAAGAALWIALLGCAEAPPEPAAAPGPELALPDGARRLDLRFPCGDDSCAAWLYLPPPRDPRAAAPPVVVMAHGFAGTRDVGLPFFAERFAREGLAAFVFDYRHFGASGGAPRQLVDPWRQLEDWKAALAYARGLPEVDGTRAALWGTSLGAGHALVTAAGDGALRCARWWCRRRS